MTRRFVSAKRLIRYFSNSTYTIYCTICVFFHFTTDHGWCFIRNMFWLKNMNFKNIVWSIKEISYFALLRSLGIIITIIIIISITIIIIIIIIISNSVSVIVIMIIELVHRGHSWTARTDCIRMFQTCFWFMMTNSWQYSQFTFLQEHSDVSWVFMSRFMSVSVQPEFRHLTTLKRHSDWCFLKYRLINIEETDS